ASARPSPALEPVTSAILPERSNIVIAIEIPPRPRSLSPSPGIQHRFPADNKRSISRNPAMRAVVIHAPHDLRVDSVEVPALGDHDVRVRMEAGGICGSDLHYYHDGG